MCGIVGALHFNERPVRSELIEDMASVLRHRGPDDAGVFVDGAVGLGHRRLKIIDLSAAGHQPMTNEDGTVWVTYNGEIYNFQELREELTQRGHTFLSRTDTEVIVHGYEEWGAHCVERFNGMFAFGLWDARQRRLLLVRDRLGIKPLFYYVDEEKLLFASEIKAILQYPNVSRELDHWAVYDYFSLNYIPSPKTPFKRIRVLRPGCWLSVQGERTEEVQYWDLRFARNGEARRDGEYIEEIRALCRDAVGRRLIADVPVGCFLSGGIDSSAVAYFMKDLDQKRLKTFSVGFAERSYDESSYARLVARHVGTEHYEIVCRPEDFRDLLETICWHADNLTADVSMVPMYLVAKLAREQVTVVLSGDGGDEVFGGYLTYQADVLASYYRRLPKWVRWYLLRPIVRALPYSARKQSLDYGLRKFVEGAEFPADKAHYTWRTIFSDSEKEQVLAGDFLETIGESDTGACYRRYFADADGESELDRILYADFKVFLADSILPKVDSMTMAHALEARVPFLDYRLVELSARVPSGLKIRGLDTKYIFKRAMANDLPQQVVFRKKEGFHPPLGSWFRGELRSFVDDVLCVDNLRGIGVFDEKYVEELKRQHFAGAQNNAFKLWGLMNFVTWHGRMVRGCRPVTRGPIKARAAKDTRRGDFQGRGRPD